MSPPTTPPQSADEALGRILHELGSLRGDVQSMRDQGDARHRTIANEMAELRAMSMRAMDIAAEAKRVADRSSTEMRDTQHALVEHTRGLAGKQAAQAEQIAKLAAETGAQTVALKTLLDAEVERKTREDERKKLEDARWQKVARWWPLLLAIVTVAGYAIGHWKP